MVKNLSKKLDTSELEQRLEKLENIVENLSPATSNNVYFSVGSTKRVQCYMCLIPFNKVLVMSDQGTKVVYNFI